MSEFRETSRALADLQASVNFGIGQHIDPNIATRGNIILGDVDFDPTKHNPLDINPLSPIGIATDSMQVRQAFPHRALHIPLAVDATHRKEVDVLTIDKARASNFIAQELDQALHGVGDSMAVNQADGEDRDVLPRILEDDRSSLFIGISDFYGIDFGDNHLDGLVAIKVNHLLEREIPANVGFISLGGAVELNTNSKKDLANFNGKLEVSHQETVERLEDLGASVVSVVVDPRLENGFDVPQVDADIASALQEMSR